MDLIYDEALDEFVEPGVPASNVPRRLMDLEVRKARLAQLTEEELSKEERRLDLIEMPERTLDQLSELGELSDLPVYSIGQMLQRKAERPPRQWLVTGLIEHGQYGAVGAERKAGKTMFSIDLAVAVASGTKMLGHFQVETCGPVLIFAGEGGEAELTSRISAVATHSGVDVATLPVYVVPRAPRLNDAAAVKVVDIYCTQLQPVLIIIDPYYLAIPDVKQSDLTSAAVPLGNVQRIAQKHGATAVIVHHWNKTGKGSGVDRYSGVGLAEWGRFLLSMSAKKTAHPEHPMGEVADLAFEYVGQNGEWDFQAERKMWRDDPTDLDSPLHYEIAVTRRPGEGRKTAAADLRTKRTWYMQSISEYLSLFGDEGVTMRAMLAAPVGKAGGKANKTYIQQALEFLRDEGYIDWKNGEKIKHVKRYNRDADPLDDEHKADGSDDQEYF